MFCYTPEKSNSVDGEKWFLEFAVLKWLVCVKFLPSSIRVLAPALLLVLTTACSYITPFRLKLKINV